MLAVLTAAATTWAAPPNLQISVLSANEITPSQQQRIDEYVTYWANQLGSTDSTAAETAQAAEKLIEPPTAPGTRSGFRVTYARAALPKLTAVLRQQQDDYRAVQAAKVIGFLGTPGALEQLVEFCDAESEPRASVRLWAARGCEVLITRTRDEGIIVDRDVVAALRSLRQAAEDEPNWLVLHRLFEAMAAAGSDTGRQRQLEAFDAVVERLEELDEPSDLMRAVTRAIVSLRDQYVRMAPSQQTAYGRELGPVLGRVQQVASTHWDAAQSDPAMKKVYGQAVQLSESLLKLIDQNVRLGEPSPSTSLYLSWQQGNRPEFQSQAQSWMDVLNSPQYNR